MYEDTDVEVVFTFDNDPATYAMRVPASLGKVRAIHAARTFFGDYFYFADGAPIPMIILSYGTED